MNKKPKYSGLCETCDHNATCRLRRSLRLKIIQCEEFSNKPVVEKIPPPRTAETFSDPMEPMRRGLCINCLNAPTCGFPKARQGVLHCEEYTLDEAGPAAPVMDEAARSAA